MKLRTVSAAAAAVAAFFMAQGRFLLKGTKPAVLPIRARAEIVYKMTQKRLDTLLPRMMRETGFDMWIIACNEDDLDPVFETMMPYENWCPITQILVFFDRGPDKGVERLNVSRTDTQGLFVNVWDSSGLGR